VYLPAFDVFARPITITPVVSQPSGAAYSARGIFSTDELDVMAEAGGIITDHQTILDLRESEFAVLPKQGDLVNIPNDADAVPLHYNDFEVIDVSSNGGGETTLTLRKWETASP